MASATSVNVAGRTGVRSIQLTTASGNIAAGRHRFGRSFAGEDIRMRTTNSASALHESSTAQSHRLERRIASLVRVLRRARRGGAASETGARAGDVPQRKPRSREPTDGEFAIDAARTKASRRSPSGRATLGPPRAPRDMGVTPAEMAKANAARLAGISQLSAQLHAHQR